MAAMAKPDTKSFRTNPKTSTQGFANHHAQTLRDLFQGVEESRAGIRTRYIPDGNQGGSDDEDVQLNDLERFVEMTGGFARTKWRKEIDRAHEALTMLRRQDLNTEVGVLAVYYGHGDPSIVRWPSDALTYVTPHLARLVRYTDATERVRQQLIDARGGVAVERSTLKDAVVLIADIRTTRRRADAERTVTSGDAIDFILDVHPAHRPKPVCVVHPSRIVEHETRVQLWREARRDVEIRKRAFFVEAKDESVKLLAQAHAAYLACWYAC